MLNSIKFKTKKIICSFVLCLGIITSAFAGLVLSKHDINVSALSTNRIVEDVTTNVFSSSAHNFNVTTSDKPTSPSGWTKLESESFNSENIVKGVVNVENETSFDTDECKTIRPSMPIVDKDTDKNPGYYKNLMINSSNGAGRYGYKTSSSITLEENSFYRISVLLYTQKTEKSESQEETDPRASIYLTGLLDKEEDGYAQTKYESVTTLNAWEEYYFYIDTNQKETVNLELWLGSKTSEVNGAVFFNKITVLRYSEDAYEEQTAPLTNQDNDYNNYNIISLRTEKKSPVTNGSFEDISFNGWTRLSQSTSNPAHMLYKSVNASTFSKVNDDLTISSPGTNCAVNNENALFLYNKNNGYQALESEKFTIEKQQYYKLSFWAKSDCNQGNGATVKLVDKTETNPTDSASLTLSTTSNSSNKFRNNWTNYNFYIYGPATESKEITIQIWLGTKESQTTGYVFVDDFKIEEIDYTTYTSNSSSSNATTFNLNNGSDKYTVKNSDFNKTENSSNSEIYPAKPASWEKTGNTNTTTISGIVNTTDSSFDSIKFDKDEEDNYHVIEPLKPSALPNTDNDDNNVLMIGSTAETNKQTYTSNTLTLSANSYYSISYYVMTDYLRTNETKNYGARVTISTGTNTIFDYQNIHYSNGGWHRIEIKIKTGTTEVTPSIKLSFENTNGYVFFDKVELKTLNEALYKDTMLEDRDTEYYRIDLSTDVFNNRTFNKNLSNGIDTPVNWTLNEEGQNSEGITSGIITSNNSLLEDIPTSLSGNTNYLIISSLHDANYAYESNETFTFNSSTYYKISVNVLTRYIEKEENKKEDIKYGASVALSDSSEIVLRGLNTDGVWKTCTIYASFTESLTSNITLGLGYADESVRGEVLFDNLKIETITEDAYLTEVVDCDPNTIATFINYTEPEDPTEEESTSTWENEVNWLILPSIITALAIIIAVVGYYIRKINFNKKPKVKTNYDRRKTLDRDIDKREKIALRKQIISELKTELDNIDKEIEEFNNLANQHLEVIKAEIKKDQEELEKAKLEIEIRKKEATAAREKQLKESAEFVADKKAEKQYNTFISRLDRQELSVQRKINAKELKLSAVTEANKEKLSKYYERQEYIKLQIAKIEAEIEEIARQEEELWAEYRAAKEDAKRRKAEFKAQVKAEKDKAKKQKEIQKIYEAKNPTAKTNTQKTTSQKKSTTAKTENKDNK